MGDLVLYDTPAGRKRPFRPRRGKAVKVFTCGPSVYRRQHIGNYRTFLYEDILVRYLAYRGFRVERTLVYTDIEDKALAEADEQDTTLKRLTDDVLKHFNKESRLLRLAPPTHTPRSSTTIDEAVSIIQRLVEKGNAYWHQGNVYFDPLSIEGFGKIYGLDLSKWPKKTRRFHQDTYPGNRWNRGDFILWHGCGKDTPFCWETALGDGYPSWNVQDPAMIAATLGAEIDIHCGGVDNLIRHHDYTRAVMKAYSGKELANYWLHGEHLTVEGRKMSKSRGNILYPEDVLDKRCRPHHLRYFLTAIRHYRRTLDYTETDIMQAANDLDALRADVKALGEKTKKDGPSSSKANRHLQKLQGDFESGMDDDLGVPNAVDSIRRNVAALAREKRKGNLARDDAKKAIASLENIDDVLCFLY